MISALTVVPLALLVSGPIAAIVIARIGAARYAARTGLDRAAAARYWRRARILGMNAAELFLIAAILRLVLAVT